MGGNNYRILVVCMGNICRSPTGEAVLRHKAKQQGISLEVDSAGTIGHHQGSKPDPRSRQAGENRGYSFKGISSRKLVSTDFEYFDLILAADNANMEDMKVICPQQYQHKLKLFLSYADTEPLEIPDPYYGGERGFELALNLIEQACDNLLTHISRA